MPADQPRKADTPRDVWILTFADLLSLLLTFFVLMFSMNAVQYEDWKAIVDALSDQLNPTRAEVSTEKWEGPDATKIHVPYAIGLDYLNTVIEDKISGDPVLKQGVIHRLDERLILSLPSDILFEPGSAILSADGLASIMRIGGNLRFLKNKITVAAHTDIGPLQGAQYLNKWELTLRRSIAVSSVLARAGYPQPIETLGYGASRFNELDPAIELGVRYGLARRIDIIVRETRREELTDNGL